MTIQQGKSKHTFPRLFGRFVSGRHMDGIRRTDSTFLQRASRDLTVHGRASRWAHLPGWHRVTWRLGSTAVLSALAWGLLFHRRATVITGSAGLAIALGLGIWRARVAILTWAHNRKLARPLYMTLAGIVGHPPGDRHDHYLTVPRNFRDDEKTVIRLLIPPTWEGTVTQQKAVHGLISRRLGGDWDARWYHHVSPPKVEFVRAPAPPAKVSFADIRAAFESGSANKLIMGIGTHNSIPSIDLDSDAPHIALSIGTGGGKSSTIRALVAYLKRHGVERIDIIDPKRVSQNWARGIPGVYIHRNMAAQMEAVHNFRLRMESRYDALDTDETLTFPRHVLVIEEQNSFMNYAVTYWEDYRRELEPAERGKAPKRNPVIGDLAFILFQGRQANMNVFSVLQQMNAKASGGGDLRSQYGAKLLARWDNSTWRMLVGTPFMRSSRINGRALLIIGDEQHAVQLPFLTETEARDYAMLGARAPASPDGGSPVVSRLPRAVPAGSGDEELMSLREIADAQVIPIRYGALRKARQRDQRFPAGTKRGSVTLYRPAEMRAWHGSRGQAVA